jgi:adenosylcobinamide-GDP ribazoletransferase
MRNLRIAFGLLTALPVRLPNDWQAGESGRAAMWYPFVGLTVGALIAMVFNLFGAFAPSLVTAALTLIVWVALTGGLHLDGLTDCFDGMFHASDPENRLKIMKDPHIGAFGVLGLVLTLLLKFALLTALTYEQSIGAILLAASLARFCVVIAGTQPMAHPTGMGADFASGLTKSTIALGALIPLGLVIWLKVPGLLSLSAGVFAMLFIVCLSKNNLGGVSGDVLGMIIEIVEVVVLLVFVLIS